MFLMMMRQILCLCTGTEEVVREDLDRARSPRAEEVLREDQGLATSLTAPAPAHTRQPEVRASMRLRPLPPLPSTTAPAVEVVLPSRAAAEEATQLDVEAPAETDSAILGSDLSPSLTTPVTGVEKPMALPSVPSGNYLSPPPFFPSPASSIASSRAAYPPSTGSIAPSLPSAEEYPPRPSCTSSYCAIASADKVDEYILPIKHPSLSIAEGPAGQVTEAYIPIPLTIPEFELPAKAHDIFGFEDTDAVLLHVLGSGAYGSVYVAEASVNGTRQQIAFKVSLARDHENWENEATANLVLEGTEGICPMFDYGASHGFRYISFGFAEQGDLCYYWEGVGDDRRHVDALTLVADIYTALAKVHEHGICHFDLKPENIFVAENAKIWIGDFGLALPLESDDLVETGNGTPGYVAPEVWLGERAGPKADVFSAGCILYALCTDSHLFPLESGTDKEDWRQQALDGLQDHHFSHPFFKGPLGDTFRALIEFLCDPIPSMRPTAAEAAEQLLWLKQEFRLHKRRLVS